MSLCWNEKDSPARRAPVPASSARSASIPSISTIMSFCTGSTAPSLFSPSGKCLHLRREETQACVLDRPAFDGAMVRKAQKAGAEYRFGHRVKDIRIDDQLATVTVTSSGQVYTVQARAAVIAAGFAPGLVARLGLGVYRDFVIGVQAEVPAPDIKEVEVYFGEVAPGFFAWLVPAAPGMVRAGLLGRQRPGFYLKPG